MIRRRNIPALISTIALIAGCGSQARGEVTGVVRDARTGRAIAGARVFAQDGSATRTDAEGRFTISVSEGLAREIRVSAAGRCDASTRLDVRVEIASDAETQASIEIELAACEGADASDAQARRETDDRVTAWDGDRLHDPDAVLRWIDDLDWSAFRDRSVLEPEVAAPREESVASPETVPAWTAHEQWILGSMTLRSMTSGGLDLPTDRPACATCHDAASFAAAHPGHTTDPSTVGMPSTVGDASACAACHDTAPDGRMERGLRVYERVDDVAGAPAHGLGSGAVCVECHRSTPDAPTHAPQADVLLGRGARSMPGIGPGPHAEIADTCVACHAPSWRDGDPETLTLGHTFRTGGGESGIARDACAACHGDVDPGAIGHGDWDGDGLAGSVSDEHDRAVRRARRAVHRRIAAERVRGTCAQPVYAQGFAERQGILWLTDAQGVLLGDCDRDGALDPTRERGSSIDLLDSPLRDAAIDLARFEGDGSRGVHNPQLVFAALGALSDRQTAH